MARLLCLTLALLASPLTGRGEFVAFDEVHTFDPTDRSVTVTVRFSEAPIFDQPADGPPTHAFGFYFSGQAPPTAVERPDFAIRSHEVREAGGLVARFGRIYLPPLGTPVVDGLGQVAGVIPFSVDGTTVTFTAPGEFMGPPVLLPLNARYRLVTFENGVRQEHALWGAWGAGTIVPEPGTAVLMGLGVGAVGLIVARSTKRS